jgi:tetratricopeptide (TPR) repeat protein
MADALELRYPRALVDAVTGHLRLRQGHLDEAVSLLERCVQTYESVDARFAILVMTGMLGPAYTLSGRVADAIGLFERTRDFADAKGLVSFNAPVLVHLGHAYSRAGRFGEAIDAASRALDLARRYQMRGYEAWTLYAFGEIRSVETPLDARSACQAYEDGKSLAHQLEMRPLEAMCRLGLGTLWASTGERARASAELTASAAACRSMGMQLWLNKAESTLASL